MQVKYKQKFFFSLILVIIFWGSFFISQAKAQKPIEESSTVTSEFSKGIRIAILASGPVKFDSYWLDSPARLVVEFKSRNVVSRIDEEITVGQGLIKRITSSYFNLRDRKALRTLTFETAGKMPYEIWQEGNTIILEIQLPVDKSGSLLAGKGIFMTESVDNPVVKRLEVMDEVLSRAVPVQLPLELPEFEAASTEEKGAGGVQAKEALPEIEPFLAAVPSGAEEGTGAEKGTGAAIVWLAGLGAISSLGLLGWRKMRLNIREDKLKAELTEEKKRVKIEEDLRKAVEEGSRQKEKECKQLKASLESLKSGLQEKDKVYEKLKTSFQLLKEKLIQKESKEKVLSFEEKRISWEVAELERGGKRRFWRLPLARDFNKTVILRVKAPNLPRKIRCFAQNVSAGGLCFEVKEEFKVGEPIDLRLFFYGGQVSSIRVQTHIVWKKKQDSVNKYGVCFDSLKEKDKLGLESYAARFS